MEFVPPLSSILFHNRQTNRSSYCQAQPSSMKPQLKLCKVYSQLSHRPKFSLTRGKITDILRSVNKFSKINQLTYSRITSNLLHDSFKTTSTQNLLLQDYKTTSTANSRLLKKYLRITSKLSRIPAINILKNHFKSTP